MTAGKPAPDWATTTRGQVAAILAAAAVSAALALASIQLMTGH